MMYIDIWIGIVVLWSLIIIGYISLCGLVDYLNEQRYCRRSKNVK